MIKSLQKTNFGYIEALDTRYKVIHVQTHHFSEIAHMNDIIGPMTNPVDPSKLTIKLIGTNQVLPPKVIANAYVILNKLGVTNVRNGMAVKVFSIYKDFDKQSPSKLLIDEVLQRLNNEGVIKLTANHFVGEAITYSSIDEALEVFLNFHMESYFNENPLLPSVIDELKEYFGKFTDEDGKIRIKPGCFTYEVEKM